MIYLASPYSHPLFLTRERRYKQTLSCIARLITEQKHIYSPIAHFHQVAFFNNLPTDAAFWQSLNEEMIRLSSEVYILQLDGWKDSIGVQHEIAYATSLNKPISYINA